MKIQIGRKLDPSKISFAHLAVLVDEDFELNKNPQINISCTHSNYVVGVVEKADEDLKFFKDITNDDEEYYYYFNNIYDAQLATEIGIMRKGTPFVIGATKIGEIGIINPITKKELKEKLSKSGLEFNFVDEDKLKQQSRLKRR